MFNRDVWLLAVVIWLALTLLVMEKCQAQSYLYTASVVRVVDGDTIDVCANENHERPCPANQRRRVRIDNIDAPEFHGRCTQETELAGWATLYLSGLLRPGTIIEVGVRRVEKWGRDLARVSAHHEGRWIDIGSHMILMGHAKAWPDHSPKPDWCGARTITIE